MRRMLIVVFDNETKAYQGMGEIDRLNSDGSISTYAYAVVAKNKDGCVTLKQEENYATLRTLGGTALGAFIGLLFGPVGLAVGGTAGLAWGATQDLYDAAVGKDFVDDVSAALTPGKVAVIAEIEEGCTTPVDSHMEAIGGTVFRRPASDVRRLISHARVAAMKADLAELKAEYAHANAKRMVKLQKKISQLDARIQAQLEKTTERWDAAERKARARVQTFRSSKTAAAAAVARPHKRKLARVLAAKKRSRRSG